MTTNSESYEFQISSHFDKDAEFYRLKLLIKGGINIEMIFDEIEYSKWNRILNGEEPYKGQYSDYSNFIMNILEDEINIRIRMTGTGYEIMEFNTTIPKASKIIQGIKDEILKIGKEIDAKSELLNDECRHCG